MDYSKIICECNEYFDENEFENHYSLCPQFKQVYKDFDKKIALLIKSVSEPKERLLTIHFLFKKYNEKIRKKIERLYQNEPNNESLDTYESINNEFCQICKINPEVIYLPCKGPHPICYDCFLKCAEEDLYGMKCNVCQEVIDEKTKKEILGEEKIKELERKYFPKNLIKCPNCGEFLEFLEGKIENNIYDDKKEKVSPKAAEHYAKNRCRCLFCKNDFCISCLSTPYHLGKTCEEYYSYIHSKKCRFCLKEIGKNNKFADEVCNDEECKERFIVSCKKVLKCGHKCFGVEHEKECPPCLDEKCKEFQGAFSQNKDDYCSICYSEGLGNSPIAVLSCGHYVHYLCIKKRLENKWPGPKITFNHCLCPTCNKWFDCNTLDDIQNMINENKKLYEEVKEMSIKRLKLEGLDKDERLTDPNSPWYGKEVEFALNRISYYMCYICKKPYFAGRRECRMGPGMDFDDPNRKFNPKDLVCGKHIFSEVEGVKNCPKHGKEFIEYKCKFCCKIASWFCWGTTHFCDECHKRQCKGDYVSKYPKNKLPICNKSLCEVGGNHPPNGEEYALGCSICRNNEENDKGF